MRVLVWWSIMVAFMSVCACPVAAEASLPCTALYVSSDGGNTLHEVPTVHRIIDLEYDPHNAQRLIALSAESEMLRIVESRNEGNTWKVLGAIPDVPRRDLGSYHLHLSSRSSSVFVFGRDLYRLSNDHITKCPLAQVKAMASSRASSRLIACSHSFRAGGPREAVCSSHDEGMTWSFLARQPFHSLQWLSNEEVMIGGLRGTVAVSRDNGKTWHNASDAFAEGFLVKPLSIGENSVFAMCGLGCYESNDLGLHWRPLLQFEKPSPYYVMGLPAGQDATIYAARTSVLFFTHDHGATWRKAKPLPYDVVKIVGDPTRSRRVYVLCANWADLD